jgi:uncharacterized protein (DUF2249 family)
MNDIALDVRTIAPHERHSHIFSLFKSLPVGGALTLTADHNPLPLYHQFNAVLAGTFDWSYIEMGPDWQVKIAKTAEPHRDEGASCCGTCG